MSGKSPSYPCRSVGLRNSILLLTPSIMQQHEVSFSVLPPQMMAQTKGLHFLPILNQSFVCILPTRWASHLNSHRIPSGMSTILQFLERMCKQHGLQMAFKTCKSIGTIGRVTTRNPECKVHSTVGSYELGAMATGEAVTLLLRTAGINDVSSRSRRIAAEPVVLTLGCLALAITQAGAVIQQGYCKMEEYCTLYSRRRKELLSQKAIQGGEDYRYTVYTTWEVSRRMIEEMSNEAGQDALELLRMFSFLHYEGISEEIFCQAWRRLHNDRASDWMISHQLKMLLRQSDQEWIVYPLRAAISILRAFSLIYHDKNGLISIHPLVHSWTRDQLSASDEDIVWRQTTTTIALSIPLTFETRDYRFRQSMMPHIDACLGFQEDGIFSLRHIGEDCQRMAGDFALVYSEVGRRQEALQLTERVVEARKRTLGEEHPDTVASAQALKNLNKSPLDKPDFYRQTSSSENKSRTQHPNGRKTKLHSPFARLWKRLT